MPDMTQVPDELIARYTANELLYRRKNRLCVCPYSELDNDGRCKQCGLRYTERTKPMSDSGRTLGQQREADSTTENKVPPQGGSGIAKSTELADKVRRKQEKETTFTKVNDSGERRETVTGAVRDRQQGKGRYDLITPIGLRRLALHYENGARKYKDRNWEKGMPLSWFIDSAIRHLFGYLGGDRSEDHMAAAAWNALGYIHIEQLIKDGKLPAELDDMGVLNELSQTPKNS